MRRVLILTVVALLMGAVASAGAPKLSPGLFASAKQGLACLAAGDYEGLCALPFSGDAPTADQWRALAERYKDLTDVQSLYAVGAWTGSIWILGVPVHPPEDASVEVLAFSSADGVHFDGCRYATWSQVEGVCGDSSKVVWDQEYLGGSATVVTDG